MRDRLKPLRRYGALPPNLPPRFIGREAAAAYFSIGTTKFDEMVAAGILPPPERGFGGRKLWDVRKLDRAADRLSDEDDGDDVWSEVEA